MNAEQLTLVDLREVLAEPVVSGLLAASSVRPVDELVDEHHHHPTSRVAFGLASASGVQAALVARTPHQGICEILASGPAEPSVLGPLIDATADHLHALAVWVRAPRDTADCWRDLGFTLHAVEGGDGVVRGERRHPPEPPGFRTEPVVQVAARRTWSVELPPEGNTLPLVPPTLSDEPVPAHVARWVLESAEACLLLQDLAPEYFPPVTPAVRPASVRDSLGSLASVLGDPTLDSLGADEPIPGLPAGLVVPVRVAELLAVAERVRTWLLEARRVRDWADERSAGDEPWVEQDPWWPRPGTAPERTADRR